jgi:hypothetical protein
MGKNFLVGRIDDTQTVGHSRVNPGAIDIEFEVV